MKQVVAEVGRDRESEREREWWRRRKGGGAPDHKTTTVITGKKAHLSCL